ncbi:MAG: TerB family tellurite resistance protein [Flavobacteriales bacterium TMED235]|nr:MAG: TerB family tellurite resistance protein [Flavobacteriales bacterium TMED235]|tara:strand:- start:116 stop:517 length:402 start_codon:yes stop_codon:yes gene_type:complete
MFLKKRQNSDLIKIGALLIHAAKIDEKYSKEEEEIVKKTLLELGANKENLDELINNAKKNEQESNQILDFTREIKIMEEAEKIKIIKSLWKIIYSNKDADIYETNLMRRLAGLLYIDSKIMGDIKEEVKKENL